MTEGTGLIPPKLSGFDRALARLEDSLQFEASNTPIIMTVLGPSLAFASPAASLRGEILRQVKDVGVTLAPDHDPVAALRARLGPSAHLVAFEKIIFDDCELLVVIPASAGSLCELAYFSMFPSFAGKMLILADITHPETGTYVADGPMLAAKYNRAQIHRVDYTDIPACASIVLDEIARLRANKMSLPRGTHRD